MQFKYVALQSDCALRFTKARFNLTIAFEKALLKWKINHSTYKFIGYCGNNNNNGERKAGSKAYFPLKMPQYVDFNQ